MARSGWGWAMGLVLAAGLAPVQAQERVTLVTAARIHTMDPARPHARAMAFDAAGRMPSVNPTNWRSGIRARRASTLAPPPSCLA